MNAFFVKQERIYLMKGSFRTVRRKAVTLVFLAFLFVFLPCARTLPAVTVGAAGSGLTELEDKLAKAARQRKEAESAVNTAKAERADAMTKKQAIDAQILALDNETDALVTLIEGYEAQIDEKNNEISEETVKLDEQYRILRQRIRSMREDGGVDLVVILFESDGLVDFLTQVDRFSCMLDYNGRLMDNYSKGIASLNSMKDELTSSKAVLEKRKSELDERRAELEVSKKEAEKLVADAEKDVATAESTLASVEALEKKYGDERSKKLAELQKTTNSQYVGGVFKWPLPSKYEKVSCGFGWRIHPVTGKPQFHNGIDIPAPYGTAITAVGDGTVVEVSYNYADGYYVTVDHGGGIASFYSHVSKYAVKVGDKVKCGQTIAYVGMSGYATGYHLNLNIYKDSVAVNPLDYFKG